MDRLRGTCRRVALAAILIAGIPMILEAWCLHFAYVQLRNGDDAYARGNVDLARLSWESAASRPAPFNLFAREAMDRLIEHEKGLEKAGRLAEALRVCFSIRGIAHSTAGYFTYYGKQEEYVLGRIPELSSRLGVDLSLDRYTLYRPIRGWSAHAGVLFFFGFVLAGFGAIRSNERRRAILCGVLAACSFVLWLFFLRNA